VQFNGILTAPFTSNIGSPQGDGLSPILFAMIEHRLEQGKRVLAAWCRRSAVWLLNAKMREILFKVCVLPAFEYSVNIWGAGGFDSNLWSQVERFWNSAARRILGVPTRTPIIALLGDLGWRPFKYRACVMACKFWTRAIELPSNSLVHQALIVQRQLVMSGERCWLSKLRTTLNESECGACFWDKYFSVPDFQGPCFRVSNESGGDVAEIRWEADFAKDCASICDRKWWSEVSLVRQEVDKHRVSESFCAKNSFDPDVRVLHVGNNNKCRSYALFKSQTLRQESYLRYVSDVGKRKLLSRFRLGVSVLRIETGRYEHNGFPGGHGLPLEWRVCLCCDLSKLEDEIHFLIECPCYAKMRERLLSKVISELKLNDIFFRSLPSDAIFMFIMESQDKVVVNALADYLWVAFKLRSQQLTQALQNTVKSVKRRRV
jgi:hypothetical protein